MKFSKRLFSLALALMLIFTTAPVFAAGETGRITIKNSTTGNQVSVAGKTFSAYKLFDLQIKGESYVYTFVNDAAKNFVVGYFNGELDPDAGDLAYQAAQKIQALKGTDLEAFAQAAYGALIKGAPKIPLGGTATAEDTDTQVTIDNLPYGYYIVEDAGTKTPISALMLTNVPNNVAIEIKADQPILDKDIVEGEDLVNDNNAAVGDVVTYRLTSTVPDMQGYTDYTFTITDTLSKGLTLNPGTPKIMIGDVSIDDPKFEGITATGWTEVTPNPNEDGSNTYTLTFNNFLGLRNVVPVGTPITIEYSATVNENAVIGSAGGNPNTAQLEFSNNPITGETGKTEDSIVRTYVTAIQLLKQDPNTAPLAGATFEITGEKLNTTLVYDQVADGADKIEGTENPIKFIKNTDGTFTQNPNGTYYRHTIVTSETVKATGISGADGVISFTGLAAGDYTITEIKAPNGYQLLQGPIKVTIGYTAPADGSNNCTWEFSYTDLPTGVTVVANNGIAVITVPNKAGSELPGTGGQGTMLIYIAGACMIAAAITLIIVNKKKANLR